MRISRHLALCLSVSLWLSAAACGPDGSYELSWTIGRRDASAASCPVTSVMDCSKVGLDSLEVVVTRGAEVLDRSLHPCFAVGEGALAHGPGLDPGQATLTVTGLSPGAQVISPPVSATAVIPESGWSQVSVVVPRPVQCADGVDNDSDGLVDQKDPDCAGGSTGTESKNPPDSC